MPRSFVCPLRPPASAHALERADFVADRIAQIGDVQFHSPAFANARWVLTRRAAIGQSRRVPRIGGLWCFGRKTNRAAIGNACRFTIDRLGNAKNAGFDPVKNAAFVEYASARWVVW